MWWLLTASGEDWCRDSHGRVLVCLGPALKLSKHPLRAILTVALLPVVIKAYDTPLCTNKILTLCLWCGLRLRRFAKPSVCGVVLHTLCCKGFSFYGVARYFKLFERKEKDIILVKSYRATGNTVRFALGCQ